MFDSGSVILTNISFSDGTGFKKRPAVILFQELDNVVVAGITSNVNMKGLALTKKEGAIKDSVIKLNYIFTVSKHLIIKELFSLKKEKRQQLYDEFISKIEGLKA